MLFDASDSASGRARPTVFCNSHGVSHVVMTSRWPEAKRGLVIYKKRVVNHNLLHSPTLSVETPRMSTLAQEGGYV